jgi:hypothetical protein
MKLTIVNASDSRLRHGEVPPGLSNPPCTSVNAVAHSRSKAEGRRTTLLGILLAQPGEKGNEAFLGLGVVGWIIIIAIVLAVAYFVSRRRSR